MLREQDLYGINFIHWVRFRFLVRMVIGITVCQCVMPDGLGSGLLLVDTMVTDIITMVTLMNFITQCTTQVVACGINILARSVVTVAVVIIELLIMVLAKVVGVIMVVVLVLLVMKNQDRQPGIPL
ncbi:MAG: hypothetical protein A3A26_00595 [Candidatus Zambryskibacteria bacterium RIFCSPLOWO2_01_FULL_47_14]|uniref:Uncharacterized protein n=1 Tax=Candidatus Zambryskibacteria bacterium RIFCSPLOWO2_01_FULL_47_14 TaxID=1802763 RepID=A0A1G2U6I8_9BACT|nr:MAG: hypothetical protein A3A26_00595 [Candidatus Zambryskibacteria bacterium RIFCSPLOWO2_01_FULL_47_14]